MEFASTVTTSGNSFAIVIPKQIVNELGLRRGMKVNMVYENEQLTISFDLQGLLSQCERILYCQLDSLIGEVISHSFKLHPVTSQVLSIILGLIKNVYFDTYGPDHLKSKFLDHIIESVQPDPVLDNAIKNYEIVRVDDKGKPIGHKWQILSAQERESPVYEEYLEFKNLTKQVPILDQWYEDTIIMNGMTKIVTDRDHYPNYNEMKYMLDHIESDEFKILLRKLWLREHTREYNTST
jgi:antitoxin component of MazEF toxin-antitoxin module